MRSSWCIDWRRCSRLALTLFSCPEYVLTTYQLYTRCPDHLMTDRITSMALAKTVSRPKQYTAAMATATSTTSVDCMRSLRVGQVTLPISMRTSCMNFMRPRFSPGLAARACWRDFCCPLPRTGLAAARLATALPPCACLGVGLPLPDLPLSLFAVFATQPLRWSLAGLEGLEPPTPGFGDRCSTN